jgi:MFS transporter, putative metabolite:H+ symporter
MSLLSLATYTAEIYPTHLRAVGGGIASAWQRGASMVGTFVVGLILPVWGSNAVFAVFGGFALVGALVAFFFAIETRAQVLENVSPASGSEQGSLLASGKFPSHSGTS